MLELSERELAEVNGGALIATELLFVATILVLGTITGLAAVQSAPAPTSGPKASR